MTIDGSPSKSTKKLKLDEETIAQLENIEHVDTVIGVYEMNVNAKYSTGEAWFSILGVNLNKLDKFSAKVTKVPLPQKI